ncbi:type II toxin-antitoxin system mRNA interferase toxin, RelE/StbE family [Holosporaceae bacterium 'Namur']|nr:type II toxin-antitoxin system mRNA interferase toxin, RelE/StbE family [Holosporaceae bacterium 'Namur']
MKKVNLSKQAAKFLKNILSKHAKQIAKKVLSLQENHIPHDSIQLKGKHSSYRRADIGEYRIIYYSDKEECLNILLIGKRNDNEIYRLLNQIK